MGTEMDQMVMVGVGERTTHEVTRRLAEEAVWIERLRPDLNVLPMTRIVSYHHSRNEGDQDQSRIERNEGETKMKEETKWIERLRPELNILQEMGELTVPVMEVKGGIRIESSVDGRRQQRDRDQYRRRLTERRQRRGRTHYQRRLNERRQRRDRDQHRRSVNETRQRRDLYRQRLEQLRTMLPERTWPEVLRP
jgi:hypothetical protein